MALRSLRSLLTFLPLALAAQSLPERAVPLNNWPAPRHIQRSQLHPQQRVVAPKSQLPGSATADSLVFVPVTPCRLADTRPGQGHPALGSTPLAALTPRTLPVAGSCGVESPSFLFPGPEAYSLNVTVVPPGGTPGGYLLLYPNPITPIPLTASFAWNPGASFQTNAVITAASSDGSVNVVANATTDVVVDINGYYAAPTDPQGDTALGSGALTSNSSGADNTAFGYWALIKNASGPRNAAFGALALAANITGDDNTAVGYQALEANTGGYFETAVGSEALAANTTGAENTAIGYIALTANTTGYDNIAVGNGAMLANTVGNENTALGFKALAYSTGNDNVGVGFNAGGGLTTGSNNIMIGNFGAADDHTIRIGDVQTSTYIAGILGNSMPSGSTVVINSNGQLGVEGVSSRRYKEDIEDMGDASKSLLKLRPVTFHYKKAEADGSKPLEYGLIAEDVADVYPELVVKGKDGQVESVQYAKLPAMLLNELQKQYRQIEEQRQQIQEQHRDAEQQMVVIKKLAARLAALEVLSSATANVASDKTSPPSPAGR